MGSGFKQQRSGRRFWWQAPDTFRCPVIGTCLSNAEQRTILKAAKFPLAGMGDFAMHGHLVQSANANDKLGRRVHRFLEKKYRGEIKAWGGYDEQALMELWDEQFPEGQIDALLWIAATHPCLSMSAIERVFADIHMMMHGQGDRVRRELAELERLRADKEKLAEKLHESWSRRQELVQQVRDLEAERDELALAAQREAPWKNEEQLASALVQLEKAERLNDTQAAVIERLQNEKDALGSELALEQETNSSIRDELEEILENLLEKQVACEDCPDCDLCGKRVLLVGGMTRLKAIYHSLVADTGGRFKYHDGRNSGGTRMLEGVIRWADIVLCPVDINSHHACLNVKMLCKKMDKPYHMMSSSGVSSVARVLAEYSRPDSGP
jgi:hypothetical protein